jgi:hypothetical protein
VDVWRVWVPSPNFGPSQIKKSKNKLGLKSFDHPNRTETQDLEKKTVFQQKTRPWKIPIKTYDSNPFSLE